MKNLLRPTVGATVAVAAALAAAACMLTSAACTWASFSRITAAAALMRTSLIKLSLKLPSTESIAGFAAGSALSMPV